MQRLPAPRPDHQPSFLDNAMNHASGPADDLLTHRSWFSRWLKRPELGVVAGLLVVTVFFVLSADPVMFSLAGLVNFLTPAAQLGILALGAALLMIGGEFDLSIGSMIAFAGLVFSTAIVIFELP